MIRRYGWTILPYLSSLGINLLANSEVFFVDSAHSEALDADDGEHGHSWEQPLATIDYAVGLCTDNQQDIILVAPTHTESVVAAAGIDLDVAGITVIGLGSGDKRPTITVGYAATAGCDIDIGAANVTIVNLIIKMAAVDVTAMIDVDGDCFTMKNCDVVLNVTSYEAVDGINFGAANVGDGSIIDGCRFYALVAAGTNAAITLDAVIDRLTVKNCEFWGDYTEACIESASILTNLLVKDCFLQNTQTGDHSIELSAAATGALVRNCYANDMTQATGVDPGSCKSYECYHCDTVDVSGILCPVAT